MFGTLGKHIERSESLEMGFQKNRRTNEKNLSLHDTVCNYRLLQCVLVELLQKHNGDLIWRPK